MRPFRSNSSAGPDGSRTPPPHKRRTGNGGVHAPGQLKLRRHLVEVLVGQAHQLVNNLDECLVYTGALFCKGYVEFARDETKQKMERMK